MRVAELTGALLDYWAAKAEGFELIRDDFEESNEPPIFHPVNRDHDGMREIFVPSRDWGDGGPIIERDKIWVAYIAGGLWCAAIGGMACLQGLELDGDHYQTGPTPLIAAMRSKVASVYGENVPDEAKP